MLIAARFTAAFAALILSASAAAQTWPAKPVQVIVNVAPAGTADVTARLLAPRLAEALGQGVVVDNRGGGDGYVGIDAVVRAAPDGYTLLYAPGSRIMIAPHIVRRADLDPVKSLLPVAPTGRISLFLMAHPGVPGSDLAGLLQHARANPGKLNYGTGNPLSILSMAQLTGAAGLDMLHVPYKGEGPLNPDLVAGRIQSSFLSTGTAISLAKDGKLRALAVLLERRSALLPDVPTIDEAGVPQVTVRQWAGVFGPPKLPREIVARLNKEVNAAVNRPDVRERLQSYGYAAEGSTPERLFEINRDDLALWKRLVKEAGIPLE